MNKSLSSFMIVVFLLTAGTAAGAQPETFKLILPGTYNISGKSTTQMKIFTEEIINVVSDVMGVKIEMEISPFIDEQYMKYSMEKLVGGKADFIGFSGEWYAKMSKTSRRKFPILFGIKMDNKVDMKYCFYVRKQDEIESVEQLRGTKSLGFVYRDVRFLLYKAGIDEKLEDFFSSYDYKYGIYTEFMKALVENEIDSFVSWDFNHKTGIGTDPRFKDIVPLGCEYYALSSIVIYRKAIDPKLIKNAQKAMLKWKTDDRFQKVRGFFYAINGGIARIAEKDLKLTLDNEKLAMDNGWEDERKKFIKENTK